MSNPSIINYGEHSLDANKFHANAIAALLRRGVSHYLGNEQASKVAAKAAKHLADTKTEMTDDEKAALKAELIAAAVQSLYDGTIGAGATRGPRKDPIESEMEKIALREIFAILDANKITRPKKGVDAVAFGDGQTKSLEAMVETRLGNHGERIRKEAEKKLAEDAKRAAKAAELAQAGAGDGPVTADALGL